MLGRVPSCLVKGFAFVDVPVALVILTLGIDITVAPSAVPGLT